MLNLDVVRNLQNIVAILNYAESLEPMNKADFRQSIIRLVKQEAVARQIELAQTAINPDGTATSLEQKIRHIEDRAWRMFSKTFKEKSVKELLQELSPVTIQQLQQSVAEGTLVATTQEIHQTLAEANKTVFEALQAQESWWDWSTRKVKTTVFGSIQSDYYILLSSWFGAMLDRTLPEGLGDNVEIYSLIAGLGIALNFKGPNTFIQTSGMNILFSTAMQTLIGTTPTHFETAEADHPGWRVAQSILRIAFSLSTEYYFFDANLPNRLLFHTFTAGLQFAVESTLQHWMLKRGPAQTTEDVTRMQLILQTCMLLTRGIIDTAETVTALKKFCDSIPAQVTPRVCPAESPSCKATLKSCGIGCGSFFFRTATPEIGIQSEQLLPATPKDLGSATLDCSFNPHGASCKLRP